MSDDFDPKSVSWVMTEADLAHLCLAIAQADEVVMDLETTGLDEHATRGGQTNGGYPARVVLASFTLPIFGRRATSGPQSPPTYLLPLSHPESPWLGQWRQVFRRVSAVIRDREKPLNNQNVKFDAKWEYAHSKVDLAPRITWDTQISSHLLDENASTKLKVRAPATFDVPPWDEFDLSKPGAAERVPLIDLGLYAARDTYWTWRLAQHHKELMFLDGSGDQPQSPEEVENARLGRLAVWCAMPMVATLTAIEQRGMKLDRAWVEKELETHLTEAEMLKGDLAERYEGLDPEEASFAPTSTWFRLWSEKAVARGDLRVAALTPTGKAQWGKSVLVRQARLGSEVALKLLELRGHTKKAEFLSSWLTYVTPDDMIHTTYKAGVVVTGRLSSEGPNMQQVTAVLKPAFIPAREGYVFADLDYSQIELRVAAFVSRCEPMIEAFRRGDDLHRLLASRITGKPQSEVTAGERQAGKSANFGLLYLISAYGFQQYAEDVYGISFTEEQAVAIHRAFFDTWEGIGAWHARVVRRLHDTGQVVSPIGRVRRLPGVWSANEKQVKYAERAAVNSAVQGFGSDLMQLAAASIEGRLPGIPPVKDVFTVATVHDDIVTEVPLDDWENKTRECMDRMTGITEVLRRMDCEFDVPLTVEAKVGTRWGLSDVGVLT